MWKTRRGVMLSDGHSLIPDGWPKLEITLIAAQIGMTTHSMVTSIPSIKFPRSSCTPTPGSEHHV
jgi:hypothetical protein